MSYNIIKLPAVIAKTGLSRSSIYKAIAQNKFPNRIYLGERSTGWIETEIDDWVQLKMDERNES